MRSQLFILFFLITLLCVPAPAMLVDLDPNSPEYWEYLDEPVVRDRDDPTLLDRLTSWFPFNVFFGSRSFTNNGVHHNNAGLTESRVRAILWDPPDKYVVAGWYDDGTVGAFLARYWLDGTLDSDFSGDGVATLSSTGQEFIAHDLTTDGAGRYLITGRQRQVADNDFTVLAARFDTGGNLDASFATIGYMTIRMNTLTDMSQIGRAIGVDSNQRIVIGGYTEHEYIQNTDLGLVRLLSNGALDNDFDTDGRVITVVDQYGHDIIYALEILTNNQIAVAGQTRNSLLPTNVADFLVARYLTNGSLDTNFGATAGYATWDITNNDRLYDLTVVSNGDLVVCGRMLRTATRFQVAVIRYGTDGTRDDSGGFNIANESICRGIAQDENGAFVMGGRRRNGPTNDWEFMAARLLTDITLDASFSSDGYDFQNVVAEDDIGLAMTYADEKFLVAGYADLDASLLTTNNGVAVVRWGSNGVEAGGGDVDTTFNGGTGFSTLDISGDTEVAAGFVRDSKGHFLIVGRTQTNGDNNTRDFVVTRFLTSGDLDTSFGASNGHTVVSISTADVDLPHGMDVDANDRIYGVGYTEAGGGNTRDWVIVRWRSDGNVDTDWGTMGIVTYDHNIRQDQARAVKVGTDNFIYVGGWVQVTNGASRDLAVGRFFSDGTLDTSWGVAGMAMADGSGFQDQGRGLVLTTLNEPIVMGYSEQGIGGAADREIIMARFDTTGALNAGWGVGGLVTLDIDTTQEDLVNVAVVTSDGGVVAAGTQQGPNDDVILMRVTSNGILDPGFGTTAAGYTVAFDTDTTNQIVRGIRMSDRGHILVIGQQMMARFFTDGSLDSYGDARGYGRGNTLPGNENFYDVYFQADGRMFLGGNINNDLGFARLWP